MYLCVHISSAYSHLFALFSSGLLSLTLIRDSQGLWLALPLLFEGVWPPQLNQVPAGALLALPCASVCDFVSRRLLLCKSSALNFYSIVPSLLKPF
jgi:hypothetical protein